MKMRTFQQFKKESLKKPGVRRAMEDADLEFQLVEAMIKARLNGGVTQKQLADRIVVAQSALARFESGRVNPTLSFMKKVTQGLGLKIVVK